MPSGAPPRPPRPLRFSLQAVALAERRAPSAESVVAVAESREPRAESREPRAGSCLSAARPSPAAPRAHRLNFPRMTRRTIAFLVFAAVVALGCARLGLWQLSRHRER